MKIHSLTDINGNTIPFAQTGSTTETDFSDYMSKAQSKTVSLDDIFQKASETYGVDIRLLKAMAKTESNFDPNATSKSGAMGIMQLMPQTAKGLGVEDAYDPEQNIMGGAKYIASLIEKYNGNVTYAVAAYNAGSGNVDKYGGVPPFEQVQNYVKKISEYLKNQDYDIPQGSENVTVSTTDPLQTAAGGSGGQTIGEQITDKLRELFTYDDYLDVMEVFLQDLMSRLQDKVDASNPAGAQSTQEAERSAVEGTETETVKEADETQSGEAYLAYQNFPSNNRISVLLKPSQTN